MRWRTNDERQLTNLLAALPLCVSFAPIHVLRYDTLPECTVAELHAALASDASPAPAVLDVRAPAMAADGTVPGATNVPFEALSDAVRDGVLEENKKQRVFVVCETVSPAWRGSYSPSR